MQKIGRYEVLEELGRGSMGVVYRARDPQIGRIVAIKVIHTANASQQEIERFKQRFQREAQAAGRMSHPGIVTIHDIAEDETGQPYLVMEYIEGAPLDFLMVPPAPRPSLTEILDIAIQVAQALDYAHRNGVIHRDIKPANILVTPDGRAKIADFGIAKLAGLDLTQEGHSVGTPSFMSPEQFRGSGVDARSDIFSFGAVLYWMSTGEKPFTGESVTEVSFKVAFDAPAPAQQRNAALPAGLDVVLTRCLAKQPEQRYSSCGELAADLEALKAGRPLSARLLPVAAPGVIPTVERTMPVPLSAPIASEGPAAASPGVMGTRGGSVAQTMEISPPAGQARASGGWWTKAKLVVASVLLLLMIGAVYGLRRGAKVERSAPTTTEKPAVAVAPPVSEAQPPAGAVAPPASEPKSSEHPAGRAVGGARRPAASSMLRILC
jgi:serine/threonine protein kinase